MGGERRNDTVRKNRDVSTRDTAPTPADDDHEEHATFDSSHAATQYRMTSGGQRYEWGMGEETVPDRAITAVGDHLGDKLDTAITRRDAKAIHQIIVDMDRQGRIDAAGRLSDMTFLPPREVAFVGEMGFAKLDDVLVAMCDAGAKVAELRAFAADIHPDVLWRSLGEKTIAKIRSTLPAATPEQIFPQINESDGFAAIEVVRWYLEVTPLELIARHMLAVDADTASTRGFALRTIGLPAWKWLDRVDAKLAATAAPGVLEAYRRIASTQADSARQANDGNADATSQGLDQIAASLGNKAGEAAEYQAAHPAKPADVRRDRKAIIAASSVLEIERETKLAGLPVSEQLDWILDKPWITIDDVRRVTLLFERDTPGLADPKVVSKLRAKFPKARPEEIYGNVPSELHRAAARDGGLRAWIVDGAQPADILRAVTFDPDHIAEMCHWLVSHGTGYSWVYDLGGHYNDMLLRMFELSCPDVKVATYVRTRLLGDAINPDGTSEGVRIIGKDAYDAPRAHLDKDLTSREQPIAWGTSPETIAADIEKLGAEEVAAIRKDPAKLRQIFGQTNETTVVRVIEKLEPLLRDVLNFAPVLPLGHFLPWAQARPASEVVLGLSHHVGSARAQKLLPLGAMETFPQLADANVLRPVLTQNPDFIRWMFDGEPQTALVALGANTVVPAAVKALDGNEDVIDSLPAGHAMAGMAQVALQALAKAASGSLKHTLETKLDEKPKDLEAPTDAERGVASMRALDIKGADFVELLRSALETDGVSKETAIQMCRRANANDVARVIKDPSMLRLLAGTHLGPTTLFPGQVLSGFLSNAEGRAWVFATVAPTQLLADPSDDMLIALSAQINRDDDKLLGTFPTGAALRPVERARLFELAKMATPVTLPLLFKTRFNTPHVLSPNHQPADETQDILEMWSVLDRLPDSHVTERSISQFRHVEVPPSNGTGGVYYPDDMHIDIRSGLENGSFKASEYDRSGASAEMTEAEAIDALGSKAAFDQFLADKRLVPARDAGKFEFAQQSPKLLELTVLHEVGHSVDARVGSHTELIYGLAGWKVYAEAEFDKWAEELGGWGDVTTPDRAKIREVWTTWLSSSHGNVAAKSVGEMVPKDHPAVADRYQHVGVVKLAREHAAVSYLDPAIVGGRAAIANFGAQRFTTLSLKGLHAAPSQYSLSTPAEYFAECYANYYREFDGSPETAKLKGHSLAPWIKQWFDVNIDSLGHMPRR